jgi:O-methyltransferase
MKTRVRSFLLLCLQKALARLGLALYIRQSHHHYVPDYYGHAARKLPDLRSLPNFAQLAESVIRSRSTSLYYDRLFTLYQALLNVRRLPAARHGGTINIAEVGVYKGGTSYFIASAVQALGFKTVTLHCFDTFAGHPEEDIQTDVDTFHRQGFFGDTNFASVEAYLKDFNTITLYRGRFQDTSSQIEDQQFHFVHLDVDIYEPTRYALDFFDSRLIVGGIIIVDDYGFRTCPGVKQAVDTFVELRCNYIVLPLLTGQCVLSKCHQGQALSEKGG